MLTVAMDESILGTRRSAKNKRKDENKLPRVQGIGKLFKLVIENTLLYLLCLVSLLIVRQGPFLLFTTTWLALPCLAV